tara:strand:+ start:184 stop:678 length:495 start_codon:yes stop_codon:yes gene_type:complete
MKPQQPIALLLIISGLLLAVLVPGGPVETRDFSHLLPLVLGVFNLFLTILGLGSLVIGGLMLRQRIFPGWSALAGISFILVYALDLGNIFPQTPSTMNQALWSIEVTGLILAMPLTILSLVQLSSWQQTKEPVQLPLFLKYTLIFSALVILFYATCAAMGIFSS